MARGNRALQAALGAVAGGFSGYAADKEYRAQQERLDREEARRVAKEEADAKREAESLARELARDQRMAVQQGWTPSDQYTGLSPRDMPGATPRKPFATTKIGEREFVIPDSPDAVKHREEVTARETEKREQASFLEAAREAGANPKQMAVLAKAPKELRSVLAANFLRPPERASASEIADSRDRAEFMSEAEAWFNTPRPEGERRTIAEAFNNLRRGNPNAPAKELIASVYRSALSNAKLNATQALAQQREASAGLSEKKASAVRAPRSGALPPGVRAPASAAKPDSSAGKLPEDPYADLRSYYNSPR